MDVLASQAALGQGLHNETISLDMMKEKDWAEAFDWSWVLFDVDMPVDGVTQTFSTPDRPGSCPTSRILPRCLHEESVATPNSFVLDLTLCSCNVLTLKGAKARTSHQDDVAGMSGPARQASLLRQFAAQNIAIFALQETRLRKGHHYHDDEFFLFRSSANAGGLFGMMMGFARLPPIGLDKAGHEMYFRESHLQVAHAEPRL